MFLPIMSFAGRSNPVRITIKNPTLRKWAWFLGIYVGSVVVFGIVAYGLAVIVPSK